MVEEDLVLSRINSRLGGVSPKGIEFSESVDHNPKFVTIGPHHRGKHKLDLMEMHKLRYLEQLLHRTQDPLHEYLKGIRHLEDEARKFYGETANDLNSNDFVEMLLLDGCFIIELFRNNKSAADKADDRTFQSDLLYALSLDLILFNNQLPFFVLDRLFKLSWIPNEPDNLIDLAKKFLKRSVPNQALNIPANDDFKHLLGLVHAGLNFPLPPSPSKDSQLNDDGRWNMLDSATELQKFGVEFKMVETGNLFDIKFNKGVLEIPRIIIKYRMEVSISTLLAYEQYHYGKEKYVTNYISFMNNLVISPKDVRLLRKKKIIDHRSVDDEAVHKLLKDMHKFLGVAPMNSSYISLSKDLNKYCKKPMNSWMVSLRQDYFGNPWTGISVLAGALLLILTIIQTLVSVHSYFQDKSK